jgi:signal transduction histidine kinase
LLAREAEARQALAEGALDAKNRAVLARTRLLRGITHDVQNPIGAADAYADLLEQGFKGQLPPAQLEFIGKIRQCLRAALGIVGDLLDLASAETGELHVESSPTSIASVVADVVDEYRAVVFQAGHTLTCHVPSDLPQIDSDPDRIGQILSNLVSNAVKYAPPPGRIELRAEWVERRDSVPYGPWVALRVADSGPGIPDDLRESVFDEFSRLRLDAAPGHGLGLAISRRISHLLGGDVELGDSTLGGAEFTLWLPAYRSDAHANAVKMATPADRISGESAAPRVFTGKAS